MGCTFNRILENYEYIEGDDDIILRLFFAPRTLGLLKWADSFAALPKTEGFFFGSDEGDEHYRKQAKEDAGLFREARRWLQKKQDGVWKSVEYEASW